MAEDIKLTQDEAPESRNFIHAFIEEDIGPGGQFEGMTVHTRFPPEPNGYLHIGHCKALIIDFGTAEKFGGLCNLRMDDTKPRQGGHRVCGRHPGGHPLAGLRLGRPVLLWV